MYVTLYLACSLTYFYDSYSEGSLLITGSALLAGVAGLDAGEFLLWVGTVTSTWEICGSCAVPAAQGNFSALSALPVGTWWIDSCKSKETWFSNMIHGAGETMPTQFGWERSRNHSIFLRKIRIFGRKWEIQCSVTVCFHSAEKITQLWFTGGHAEDYKQAGSVKLTVITRDVWQMTLQHMTTMSNQGKEDTWHFHSVQLWSFTNKLMETSIGCFYRESSSLVVSRSIVLWPNVIKVLWRQ